jgi:zinc transport system substrate-binding protein
MLLLTIYLLACTSQAAPKVVVSIMPIHSLVSGLMSDIAAPYLLLQSNQSPHTMTLKPSDARALNQADLIVWVGESLETPLARLINNLEDKTEVVSLIDLPNIDLLPIRNNPDWTKERHQFDSTSHHHHDHDSHIWLSPKNARSIVRHLAEVLIKHDPANRDGYQRNRDHLLQRLDTLERDFSSNIAAIKTIPYIVFHDAYQYLEDYFGLNAVGSVNVSPERLTGAKHLHYLREKIHRLEARCVFSEPQFEPKLIQTLISGTSASAGNLDPLGSGLPPGKEAYFQLMLNLSEKLAACLGDNV